MIPDIGKGTSVRDSGTGSGLKVRVFDVQQFCLHDGPGIRTVVFFKGCPLRCLWCQNPESIAPGPQVAFYAERCAGCGLCRKACPNEATVASGQSPVDSGRWAVGSSPMPEQTTDHGSPATDRALRPALFWEKCRACGACANACPHEALRLVGRTESVEHLLETVSKDTPYYAATGGGVTLSGGEPLLQSAAAATLLASCRGRGLGTAIETCGAVPWSAFEKVIPFADLFYFDLKARDDTLHRALTGAPARRIFENARRLIASGAEVAFRMPVVPGRNDSEKNVRAIAAFLIAAGRPAIRLLKYHAGGETKLARLGAGSPATGIRPAEAAAALGRTAALFQRMGIRVVLEGEPAGPRRPARARPFPARVRRLREAVRGARPAVCPERALLVTEYFRSQRNRAKPVVVQKAEALAHVLQNRSAAIYDGELLVGCFSSHRVGGSILPELHGTAVLLDLLSFDKREVNPLGIAPEARRALATSVLPFWLTRCLAARAFPFPRSVLFAADQLRGQRYIINETGGISHFVPDYERLLALGTSGIAAEAARREGESADPAERDFLRAVQVACGALEALAVPYAGIARRMAAEERSPRRRAELRSIARACERVPRYPARTLHEAFQSLVFAQIALNQESLDNSVSPGRLDQVLYPYYRADIEAGRTNDARARELVGCFTVKLSEIIPVFSRRITRFHGGLFNGQVVVVGGRDRGGNDATNALTWMFLDAMDALRMRQPNFHVRIHSKSPKRLVERVAGMLRDGSGAPSLMNDDVVVPMLVRRGMTRADALDYSPVGCVEPVACGRTFGSTDAALLNIALCLERALGTAKGEAAPGAAERCASLEDVISLFAREVRRLVDDLVLDLKAIERANAAFHPTPLTSMLIAGCIESGTDSTAGGALYNASGVQAVGVIDVADSLAAIGQVVFEDGAFGMAEVLNAVRRDFEGRGAVHGRLLRAPKFGNDDQRADRLADRVMGIFSDALAGHQNTRGGPYLGGFYSVTAHAAFGRMTGALPSGRRRGRPLASGLSPSNGLDRLGPTASLNSAASLDLLGKARNGCTVNLKLDGSCLRGNEGTRALAGLVRGYFKRGGMQVQTNVLDPGVLAKARDDPQSHPWLVVRVSGYSAYFNDLSPEMKQEIIDRSSHGGLR
jgi:formate C-acetyltransferase